MSLSAKIVEHLAATELLRKAALEEAPAEIRDLVAGAIARSGLHLADVLAMVAERERPDPEAGRVDRLIEHEDAWLRQLEANAHARRREAQGR